MPGESRARKGQTVRLHPGSQVYGGKEVKRQLDGFVMPIAAKKSSGRLDGESGVLTWTGRVQMIDNALQMVAQQQHELRSSA